MKYTEIILKEESAKCLLCDTAPCSAACPAHVPVKRIMKAVRFDNEEGAAALLPVEAACSGCKDYGEKEPPCMKACARGKIYGPVEIREVLEILGEKERETGTSASADLSIDFCGVHCENPFFLSSSVVASNYEMVARAFEQGWGGACMKTRASFTSENTSPRFDCIGKEDTPFVGFKNIEQLSEHSLEEDLDCIRRLKRDYPKKVVIASIMGETEAQWTTLARQMEEAGADIIECNFSCPHVTKDGLGSDVGQNPELVAKYTAAVRRGTRLPVLAKMTPNTGHIELPAKAAIQAGADGIAAINTIKSIMNINLNTFASGPDVAGHSAVGGYSGKAIKPIALRFIYEMKKEPELCDVPISGMGGIETWRDGAEFLALGCSNLQVTTAVMQYGYGIIEDLCDGLRRYLSAQGMKSVQELAGRAVPSVVPMEELEFHSVCYPKIIRERCVDCGRCITSCRDGGHQALRRARQTGAVILDVEKCVGCHLCRLVCPAGAIAEGKRVRFSGKKRREIKKI